jgi:hypothetical protein
MKMEMVKSSDILMIRDQILHGLQLTIVTERLHHVLSKMWKEV